MRTESGSVAILISYFHLSGSVAEKKTHFSWYRVWNMRTSPTYINCNVQYLVFVLLLLYWLAYIHDRIAQWALQSCFIAKRKRKRCREKHIQQFTGTRLTLNRPRLSPKRQDNRTRTDIKPTTARVMAQVVELAFNWCSQ